MQKYTDVVLDKEGRPVWGATVTVCLAGTTTPASLFSDDGVTSLPNPTGTDPAGTFTFYAPNGKYDLSVSGTDNTGFTITGATESGVSLFDPASNVTLSLVDDIITKRPVIDVRYYGAKCDGVTDDTSVLQSVIDAAVALGVTSEIIIPGPTVITNLQFGGTIPIPNYTGSPTLGRLRICGVGNGNLTVKSGTTGSVLKLGKSSADMNFVLELRDLIIDCNGQNVVGIDGVSYNHDATIANTTVEFDNVTIRDMSGANSYGIKLGNITSNSRINNLRLYGGASAKTGILLERSEITFANPEIMYFTNAIEYPGDSGYGVGAPSWLAGGGSESGIIVMGGAIVFSDNILYFDAAGSVGSPFTYVNNSAFHGVNFGGDAKSTQKWMSVDAGFYGQLPQISFIDNFVESKRADFVADLSSANYGLNWVFIGNYLYPTSTTSLMRFGQFANVTWINNTNFTYSVETGGSVGLITPGKGVFSGGVVGNVTGNLTGNVTGDVSGSISGPSAAISGAANVGSFSVGGATTTIKKILKITAVAVDLGSIAATTRGTTAVTVSGTPGIAAGDAIIVLAGISGFNDDLVFEHVEATGTDQISFRFYNPTSSPIDDTSHNVDILWIDLT